MKRAVLLLVAFAVAGLGQKYYVYVGNLAPTSALLAWGTTEGTNTIGRSSFSHGEATIKIAGRTILSQQNWTVVADLKPDTEYPYEVGLKGRVIGKGSLRTWPASAAKLVFFVIGDYGTGSNAQWSVAKAMSAEFERRAASDNPVRFVITTGDNIYGDISTVVFGIRHTGNEDRDWQKKFFEPYEQLLAHIPFYPTLGNHDGNETENRGDLPAYLDNFFFPEDKPARWYSFNFGGGLADFFALDSTRNSEGGSPQAAYLAGGAQTQWLQAALVNSKATWKIPYYHHPVFSGGPRHVASYRELRHWISMFANAGVKVVFNGHEHNFQYSEVNELSGSVRFITSGAGGELRAGGIQGRMRRSNIAGFSPQNHFLVVEIDAKTMQVTPLSREPLRVVDAGNYPVTLPLTIKVP